ncbi:MAG: transglutaminaseTgpA domain-containing protein [Acidobacteriota bacterium]|nr:transglutaminaseTgpA domain-containing protein [Acidobacteriota bacterium]
MPLNQLRILTLPVIGSVLASFFSGDLEVPLLAVALASMLPLFYINDLEAIRNHGLWKLYGALTFIIVVMFYFMRVSMKYSIFFLVFFCIVYEFYGEKRPRAPSRLLALLSFLILLYHARVDAGLALFGGVLLYLFSLVLCLMLLHASESTGFRRIPLKGLTVSPLHFGVIFAIGMSLFWIMPRFPYQELGAIPSLLGDRTSGFGNRVNLNDIGSLKRSKKHIMDIMPLNGELHDPYIKGRVLDFYRKGTWSTTVLSAYFPSPKENQTLYFREPEGDELLSYRIDLQPLHGNTVFYLDNLVSLKGNLHPVKVLSGLDHISVIRPLPVSLSYTVTSMKRPVRTRMGRRIHIYTQIHSDQQYFGEIAREILGAADNPASTTPEKVNAFLNYFSDNFGYTLDVNNQGKDPLYHFMKEKREGHCELFASSMVFLLRSQRIPARLVTGFLMTQKHPNAEFYHITESDAHAWVEYFHDGAWHKADPTPPVAYEPPGFLSTQLATLQYLWRKSIMTFNHESQKEVILYIQVQLRNLIDGVVVLLQRFAWLVILIFAGVTAWILRYKVLQPDTRLARLYSQLEHRLTRTFGERKPDEGIYDYIDKLTLDGNLKADLTGFLQDYHRFRFAARSKDAPKALIHRLRALLPRLEEATPAS